MSRPRVHFLDRVSDGEFFLAFSVCGMSFGDAEACTRTVEQVTCKLCQKRIEDPVAIPVNHAPLSFASLDLRDSRGVLFTDPNRQGCRFEMRVASDDSVKPQWSTWQSFLDRYYRMRDDGHALKSTSDPSRFEGHSPSQTTPEGDRAQRLIGEYAFAIRILEGAYANGLRLSDVPRRELTQSQCHSLLEARIVGRLVPSERKGGIGSRVAWEPSELAAEASKALAFDLTPGDVQSVYLVGGRFIEEALIARGMVSHRDARLLAGDEMADAADKPWTWESWKEIAGALGRSIGTVKRWSTRDTNPMPVHFVLGRVVARREDVEAWLREEVARSTIVEKKTA